MARTTAIKQITFPRDLDQALRDVSETERRSQSGILACAFAEWYARHVSNAETGNQPSRGREAV